MSYKPGQIVVIPFPFSDLSSTKVRPAVVVSNDRYNQHHNVLLAGIYGKKKPCALALSNSNLVGNNLSKDSFISVQNIFACDNKRIIKVIDEISPPYSNKLSKHIHDYLL